MAICSSYSPGQEPARTACMAATATPPTSTPYLRRLSRALTAGGRIVNVDYHKKPTPVGPSMDHRLSREDFSHQYFVVQRPAARAN